MFAMDNAIVYKKSESQEVTPNCAAHHSHYEVR